MNYTNNNKLPEALCDVIARRDAHYQRIGDISVTEMIGPPIIPKLRREHAEEITVDYSDQIYALLGSAVHDVIANYGCAGGKDLCEIPVALLYTVNEQNIVLSGTLDMLDRDGVLIDFKTTSIYAFLMTPTGVKPEWEAQLNVYARLGVLSGLTEKPKGLRIVAILKDWTAYQARTEQVPKCPVQVVDVQMWSDEKVDAYIHQRLGYHLTARMLDISETPICTKAERWQGEIKYAVFKGTNKRATKVCDTESEALDFIAAQSKGDYRIEQRAAMPRRCQDYCDVCAFCVYGKQLIVSPEDVPSEDGLPLWSHEYNSSVMEA